MAKKEFLQKAKTYNPSQMVLSGAYVSDKLDGFRIFSDGGVSRGKPKAEVPWANTDKDERYLNEQIATGLWTQSGNIVYAPDEFLDLLPAVPLDGELYSYTLTRQELFSLCKKQTAEDVTDWMDHVEFKVFDIVPMDVFCWSRSLRSSTFTKEIDGAECLAFIKDFEYEYNPRWDIPFMSVYKVLSFRKHWWSKNISFVENLQLPFGESMAQKALNNFISKCAERDGFEGVMIRNGGATYECSRTSSIMKIKPRDDAEATVIGYTAGREGKTGRMLGLMGALTVKMDNGIVFDLSGFNTQERLLTSSDWATENPGRALPETIEAINFPRGERVNFTYRGLTNDGVPQEAQYNRKDLRL